MTWTTSVNKTVAIEAPSSKVWAVLTTPELIREWLSDADIEAKSSWKVGEPIHFVGNWHGIDVEDKGTILRFEPEEVFQYNYWSKISGLSDAPENRSVIDFKLTFQDSHTTLRLAQSNIPSEAAYHHWNFYWNMALDRIKRLAEGSA